MQTLLKTACAAVATAAAMIATSASAADVTVTFIHPETFRDASYSQPFYESGALTPEVGRDVEKFLVELGRKRLPANESLKIEVLDLDMAGRIRPIGALSGDEIRVVRDADWPRMKVRYSLTRGELVLASGEETMTDMDFMSRGLNYASSDRLRFEKAMMERWFRRTLERPQAASR
ncbi:hypothetical protein BH10PSE17_BH10PSE17_28030 [soil metagenome]